MEVRVSTFPKRLFIEELNALFRRENDTNIYLRQRLRHAVILSLFCTTLTGLAILSFVPRVALAGLADPGLLN